MKNFASLIVIFAGAALLIYIFQQVLILINCAGKTIATLDHTEERYERDLNARGALHKYYVGIYRYKVGDTTYVTEAMRYKNDPGLFEIEKPRKVRYNVVKPEIAFINGRRCKERFKFTSSED
ncbi:MAG: hypothetical protein IKR39_02335 [Lachnospiraceae bacterium]|nr:hypothetical protein [Lachnospiraceae bacterium]